ncbi:HAD family hydrolase [Spongorhabdus nitratireducens]
MMSPAVTRAHNHNRELLMDEPRPIEAVLFDLDGTLVDTADDFVLVLNQQLRDYNRPELDPDVIRRHVSAGSRTLIGLGFELEPGIELENLRNEFLDRYDQHLTGNTNDNVDIYPGLGPLLEQLEARGIQWGIVTNKPERHTLGLMHRLQRLQASQVLICPDHVQQSKPDPEGLLIAAERLGCKPENCVYIGDHLRDVEAGLNAGMLTIAVHYGYLAPGINPYDWPAHQHIENDSGLLPWFEQQGWVLSGKETTVTLSESQN